MKEFVVYTLSRLGLFVASYVLVLGGSVLVTGRNAVPILWPFLAGLVLSSIASVYLLRGQRERLASVVERRAAAATRRFDVARSKEDEPEV